MSDDDKDPTAKDLMRAFLYGAIEGPGVTDHDNERYKEVRERFEFLIAAARRRLAEGPIGITDFGCFGETAGRKVVRPDPAKVEAALAFAEHCLEAFEDAR